MSDHDKTADYYSINIEVESNVIIHNNSNLSSNIHKTNAVVKEKKKSITTRFLSIFIGKDYPIPEKKLHTYPRPNWFSYLFFTWVGSIVKIGFSRKLEKTDLFIMDGEVSVDYMTEKLLNNFDKRLENYYNKKRNQGLAEEEIKKLKIPTIILLLSVSDTFGKQFWLGGLLIVITDLGQTVESVVVKKIISFVQGHKTHPEDYPIGKGIGYSLGLLGMIITIAFTVNHSFYLSMMTGAKVRSVLTNVMYQKSMRLSNKSKTIFTSGKITTLVGSDLSRVDFGFQFFHFNYSFIFVIILVIALLIVNLGAAALIGVAIGLIAMVALLFSLKSFMNLRLKINKQTDKRVSMINEVINSMKIVKYYAWEEAYDNILSKIRTNEMNIILDLQALRNFINALVTCIPIICAMVSFVVIYAIGNDLDAANVFSSMTLFNIFRLPLIMLPISLSSSADAFAAFDRISLFLQAEEGQVQINNDNDNHYNKDDSNDNAIIIENASFVWETATQEEKDLIENNDPFKFKSKKKESKDKPDTQVDTTATLKNEDLDVNKDDPENKTPTSKFKGLNDINLSIKKNELIILTGSIGTGKTSLLYAISGMMQKTNGNLFINGKLNFCSYPWIQNTTIRENIIFGSKFDEKRYNKIINICELNNDLNILPAGDLTEIGEKGINLSGGQKSRINLARSIYLNYDNNNSFDIILLDDVLSAVDAKVGKNIMNNCIIDYLKNKTRILATHQLSLIKNADRIIYLSDDNKFYIDTLENLINNVSDFKKLFEFSDLKEKESKENKKSNYNYEDEIDEKEKEKEIDNAKYEGLVNGQLTEDEDSAEDSVPFYIYKKYILLGSGKMGYFSLIILLFLSSLSAFLQIFSSVWLSFWTSGRFDLSSGIYIGLYVMFGILSSIVVFSAYYFGSYIFNRAGLNIYKTAARSILYSKMTFFDITPMGRILNRFTKDTDVIDNELSELLNTVISFIFSIIGTVVLTAVYLPWILLVVGVIFIIYHLYFEYYIRSSREVKRIEATSRSIVYSNINETMNGLDTIKSFNQEERFKSKNSELINDMNSAYFLTLSNQRWLSIRIDIISSIATFIIAVLCVNGQFSINASSTGLLLSNIIEVSGFIGYMVRLLTQVQNDFISVERLYNYGFELDSEAPYHIEATKPNDEWPINGSINFKNVYLNYRPNLPFVLKDISFEIKPNEKIGICGRTGSGKSTIMGALFRLTEISKGSIIIDDIDTSTIGLFELRSKMAVIPQDPALFLGTIRSNLDPFDQFSDDELWNSIQHLFDSDTVELMKSQEINLDDNKTDNNKKNIHKFHLDQVVEDGGSNFSLGERQLLALARALVKKSKILILDEATSSVDYETDFKIQNTISKEFNNCTILCIAHRLKTILQYDRIMVLDQGVIQEFDTPLHLFNDKTSLFSQMCEKSSITEADF